MNKNRRLLAALIVMTGCFFALNSFAVSRQVVNSFYNYARSGQTAKIRQLMKMGYGIDAKSDDGYSPWCLAKQQGDDKAMEVLEWMGAKSDQTCVGDWGAGKTTLAVLGVAAVGGGVALAAGGGGGGGAENPCASKPNSSLVEGSCVCNEGFIEQGGVCYTDLQCGTQNGSTGVQNANQCVCREGYYGPQCNQCSSGYIQDGVNCYKDLHCEDLIGSTGVQNGNSCVCNTENHAGQLCDSCISGYVYQSGACYAELDCKYGTQSGNQCVCNAGYTGTLCDACADGKIMGTDGLCYPNLGCVNGTQQDATCVCNAGYAGTLCDECADGAVMGNDGQCYENLNCSNQSGSTGTQNNDMCECKTGYEGQLCDACAPGYGHDSSGNCVAKNPDGVVSVDDSNYNKSGVNITNTNYADVYGIKYDAGASGNTVVGQESDLYNNYSSVASGQPSEAESVLKINNNSDGNVYGLYSENASAIYNMYTSIAEDLPDTSVSSLIDIINVGNGDVYGISGTGEAHNGYYVSSIGDEFSTTLSSNIQINNTGSGNVYGIYSVGNVYNDNTWSKINISSTNNDTTTSNSVYGLYSSEGGAENQGEISITSNSGETHGMASFAAASNQGSITVSSSDSFATGISAADVDNSGSLNISSTAGGMAYGVNSSSGSVTNSGTIQATGGTSALGIYAPQSTSVLNSGTIDVSLSDSASGGEHAYGIYAMGSLGTLNNTGSLSITNVLNVGQIVGIYANSMLVENGNAEETTASVNISSSSANELYGIFVGQGSVTNFAGSSVTLTDVGGKNIVGIFAGDNSQITHNGSIAISSLMQSAEKVSGIVGENITLADTATIDMDVSGMAASSAAYGINSAINNPSSAVIKNGGNITISGNTATAMGVYASASDITNSGSVNVTNNDTGTAYGIWSEAGGGHILSNTGTITVNNATNNVNDSVGYGLSIGGGELVNEGTVSVGSAESYLNAAYGVSLTSASVVSNAVGGTIDVYGNTAYGISASAGSDVTNNGSITVVATNGAYGISVMGGRVNNALDANISVTSAGDSVYGIWASENSIVDNSGTITVNTDTGVAYGIYADNSSVTNSGNVLVTASGEGGTAYGIYATNGATVTNTGSITVNGTACTEGDCSGAVTNGNFIVIDDTSTFMNASLLSFEGAMDIDSFGGTTMLAKSGKFASNDVISADKLLVSADVVEGGFEDEYVEEGAFQAQKVDVNAVSNSAMFTASLQDGEEEGTQDLVMTRKSFDLLSSDTSIANFLANNYEQENNEELFNSLKRAPSLLAYSLEEANLLGYSLLPNFSRENMQVLRNLTDVFANELFETENNTPVRKMVGYDYFTQNRDTKGTLTGYDNYANTMYFMYDRELEASKARLGAGMSITQFYSSYDDDSSRKEIMLQVLMPAYYEMNNGIKLASVARVGYGDGDYKRKADGTTFEGDLSEWIYGLSNAARYGMDWGWVIFEPTVELNVLGYYQDGIDEDKGKSGAISTDAENNLSVEAGIGFRMKKDIEEFYGNKLSFNLGAMYYHEFADPYHSLTASMEGMTGTYRITDYEGIYDRDRGVIKAGFEYGLSELTLYGNFYQFIEDENPFSINLGLKYNF